MGENSGHRIEKVNQLVKEEVGKIILRDLDVSKNTLLTITSTKTSSDLKHATVFISTIDKEKAKSALFELEKKRVRVYNSNIMTVDFKSREIVLALIIFSLASISSIRFSYNSTNTPTFVLKNDGSIGLSR